MPWKLRPRGVAIAAITPIPLTRARNLQVRRLPPAQVVPGYTLGGLFLADYGPGSDVEYNELVLVSGLTRGPAGISDIAWHVVQILVDRQTSCDAGRELLGVPKQMAEFRREPRPGGDTITVFQDGCTVCTVRRRLPWWVAQGQLSITAAHADVGDPQRIRICKNSLEGVAGLVSIDIEFTSGVGVDLFRGCRFIGFGGKDVKALLGQPVSGSL